MVNPEEFKKKIKGMILQEYTLEFLGSNFDEIVTLLSDTKAEKICQWLDKVIRKEIQPITIGTTRPYKGWTINQLLVFRYPLTLQNNEYRILFVKVKNYMYIEFHLGDHKYYDKVRKDLDLKKSSY